MKYYVYVLLNPLKSGIFKYGEYVFDYEPFYVGKGMGKRKTNTLSEKKNKFKWNIIQKIKSNNLKPIRIILVDKLCEDKSFEIEKKLIKLIGRRDLNKGTLTNFTDGGEGTSGIIQSEETKLKRKKTLKKYRQHFKTKEFSEKMKLVSNDRKKNPEYIKYCEELSIKYRGDGNPMFGKKTSDNQKNAVSKAHAEGKIVLSDEGKKKIIEAAHKRKGKKNKVKKCDSKKYELISPNNEKFVIFGAVDLQNFCKKNKLQYHVLKNNLGVITENMVVGNKIFAKNTIGWKMKKN